MGGRGASSGIAKYKARGDVMEAKHYMQEEFGVMLVGRPADWSTKNLNETNEALFNMRSEFGDSFLRRVKYIESSSTNKLSNGIAGIYDPNTYHIVFAHTNDDNLWDRASLSSYNTINGRLSTQYHELGHALEETLNPAQLKAIASLKRQAVTRMNQQIFDDAVASGINADYLKTIKRMSTYNYNIEVNRFARNRQSEILSQYGFSNKSEFIAESVADYMVNRKKAKAMSKEVVKVIKDANYKPKTGVSYVFGSLVYV